MKMRRRRSGLSLPKNLSVLVICAFAAATLGHSTRGRAEEALPTSLDGSSTPRTLAIKSVDGLKEVQTAVFEIAVTFDDGSHGQLRMNAYVLQSLLDTVDKAGDDGR